MPSHPIEPDKLLDAAARLASTRPGRGRPPYTAHRRAISTAYYAVFHAVSGRVVAQVFPQADEMFRARVGRWIGHAHIKAVARWVRQLQGASAGSAPAHIEAVLSPSPGPAHIDMTTAAISNGFLELTEKREQADYDHEAVFSRKDTWRVIALARHVVALVGSAQTDESQRFFGLIAMQAQVQKR